MTSTHITIRQDGRDIRYTQQSADPWMWDFEFRNSRGRWTRSLPVTGQKVLWDLSMAVQRDAPHHEIGDVR